MSRGAVLLGRHLLQRCTIAPYDDATDDAYNQPTGAFGTPVTGIRCRISDLTDKEIASVREGGTSALTDAILVPKATVVTVGSRVTNILARDGVTVLEAGPFKVIDVTTRYSDQPEFKRVLMQRVQ